MRKLFENIVLVIRECCDPDEILLFGSFAKGSADVDSDVDLIIVGTFGPRQALVEREVRDLLTQFPLKMDVLFLSPQQVTAAGANPHSFFGSALSSVRSLYRKEGQAH
jgi:predicted nucleotidyltransferase